jgi:thiol-disulfide isomerase/thioredoxin
MFFILLICFNTYSQTKIDVDLYVTKNSSDFFLLSESSLKLSKKNEITFKSEKLKNYLVYEFSTNDYKRFFKDYKEGIVPDSIFKLSIANRKIDFSDFKRLDNDDIIELLVGIDIENNLIVVPNVNNNQTFDDDSIYQFKLGLDSEKEFKLENINFKNINYYLGLDSSNLNFFANLKLIIFKNDFTKSKIYLYNNTYHSGKFSINDTSFIIKINLVAGGLDFKYKYYVEYKIYKVFDNINKLSKDDAKPYQQGDTIKIGYNLIYLDSIEKFGKKAFLSYVVNKEFYSDSIFFSSLILSNITTNQYSTPLDNSEYKILDFWTSWCIPCVKQHSILEKNYKLLKQKKITVIGINLDKNDVVKSKEYLKHRNLPWRNYSLANWDAKNNIRVRSYPTYFLLSPKNNVLLNTYNVDSVINYINKL